jgi:(heptosyl)LPS beta-1,4-glucosyltransferase
MANKPLSTDPNTSITAVIITRNEEGMIANCLEALKWCDARLVLDTGSTDHTRELAERAGATVYKAKGENFSAWRNEAATHVKTAWILYIDADERVTPPLAKAIQSRVRRTDFDAYTIRRNNIHLGRWMQFGGWQYDNLLRLMKKENLKQWVGDVHEHAEILGRLGVIEEPLVHLTHRNLFDGLRKSADWTDVEAHLLLEANHPKVGPLRLLKIVIFDFINRVVFKLAWKDGPEGMIEAMVQTMNRFLVYTRLWELQQKPSLEKRYEHIEKEIQRQWHET